MLIEGPLELWEENGLETCLISIVFLLAIFRDLNDFSVFKA